MERRRPRKDYGDDDYPRFDQDLSRRTLLRRLGGLGGIVLFASGPWAAALAARADEEGWVVTVPPADEWHVVHHGDQPVYWRLALDVTDIDVVVCIEDGTPGLIESIDTHLLALDLADIESTVARPAIEEAIVAIVADACPHPESDDDDPAGDDDSAADDDPPDPGDHPSITLLELDLKLTAPEEEWDLMGVIAEPACACRLPRP